MSPKFKICLKDKGPCSFPLPGRPPVLRDWGTQKPDRAGQELQPTQLPGAHKGWLGPAVVCLERQAGHRYSLGTAAVFWDYLNDQITAPPYRKNFSSHPSHCWHQYRGHTNLSVLCLRRCPRLTVPSWWGKALQNTLSKSVCFNSRLNALKSPTYVFNEKMAKQ